MIKYAKLLNKDTGLVLPLFNEQKLMLYKAQGYKQYDIKKSDIDKRWYLVDKCPSKTEEQLLAEAKEAKLAENDEKANAYLHRTITIEIGKDNTPFEFYFDKEGKTERNLNSAALGFLAQLYETKEWTDEQGITAQLTAEDITKVLLTFNDFANALWAKWGVYKQQIINCKTKEEVNAIIISFNTEENNE